LAGREREELKQRDITVLSTAGVAGWQRTAAQEKRCIATNALPATVRTVRETCRKPATRRRHRHACNGQSDQDRRQLLAVRHKRVDYIHRAMPLTQPGSLSADDTYAVTAFLLNRNKFIEASESHK